MRSRLESASWGSHAMKDSNLLHWEPRCLALFVVDEFLSVCAEELRLNSVEKGSLLTFYPGRNGADSQQWICMMTTVWTVLSWEWKFITCQLTIQRIAGRIWTKFPPMAFGDVFPDDQIWVHEYPSYFVWESTDLLSARQVLNPSQWIAFVR